MTAPPNQNCKVCRYFRTLDHPDGYDGVCMRFPPDGGMLRFPIVKITDWCGEYQP